MNVAIIAILATRPRTSGENTARGDLAFKRNHPQICAVQNARSTMTVMTRALHARRQAISGANTTSGDLALRRLTANQLTNGILNAIVEEVRNIVTYAQSQSGELRSAATSGLVIARNTKATSGAGELLCHVRRELCGTQ